MPGPRVAYILLWFPEPTQTFVLDEVNTLMGLGLDLRVYTLYGPCRSRRMSGLAPVTAPVRHLGLKSLGTLLLNLACPGHGRKIPGIPFLARVLGRRWRSLETGGEAGWATLAGVHLARIFLESGIDLIHAPWADGPATAAWVASSLSGIPFSFCARAHDIYPPDGALAEKIAAAALVRTENQANLRYLATLTPQEAGKMVSIYNGVPLRAEPRFSPPPAPPFRLLALGRFVPKKGFAVLLEACRWLAATGLDFHLTLAGDGPGRHQLQRLIRRFGLEQRVALPGFMPHGRVSGLFQEAHLFVMPSVIAPSGDRDGTPTVISEALLHGVPVVATEVCGIPEMIIPGETGWLALPGDSRALAAAMQEALADPGEARRRARAGRELIIREFDSRRNYGKLKDCFANVVSDSRK